jgi:hypothetical protein
LAAVEAVRLYKELSDVENLKDVIDMRQRQADYKRR